MEGRFSLIEGVRARLADEQGTLHKEAPYRVALCYPSPYHVGMSSLGYQSIYRQIHAHPGATAERAFLPDDVEAFRGSRTPLFPRSWPRGARRLCARPSNRRRGGLCRKDFCAASPTP